MAEAAGHSLVGKHAPAATVRTIDGETIDLAGLYGRRPVYLKFWATWCAPCLEQVEQLKAAHEGGGDLAVVAVNAGFNETESAVRRYRDRHGLRMPVVIDDGRLSAALNLRVTPQHVVVGRDGRILHVGHLADAKLDRALAKARRGGAGGSGGAPIASPPAVLRLGEKVPALILSGAGGEPPPLWDPQGKRPTVLVFLSPWCESYLAESRPQMAKACRAARERVETLASAHPEVRWVGVAAGLWATAQDVADYRREAKVTIPIGHDADGGVFRRFGVVSAPAFARLDREGRLTARAAEIDAAFVKGDR